MKHKNSRLLVPLALLLFSFIACNDEKTAGTEISKEVPLSSNSKSAVEAFNKGLAFIDENDRAKARSEFEKATAADSNFTMAYLYRAALSQTAKEFVDELEKSKKHLPDSASWEKSYYDYQYSYITNNWDDRLAAVKKITELYPEVARAQVDLGYVYQEASQTQNERAAFQKAISLQPEWPAAYIALAGSYLTSSPTDFKKAEENALKATELAPKSAWAQVTLGDVYRALDVLDKAAVAYGKAISLEPGNAIAYYKKGHVNSFLGKYEDARNDYAEGLKLDQDGLGANVWTSLTNVYAGDSKKAVEELETHAAKLDSSKLSKSRIDSEKLNDYYACATICFQAGDFAGVKKYTSLMQTPTNNVVTDIGTDEEKRVQDSYLLYWQGLALASEGKMQEAKDIVEMIKKNIEPIKLPSKAENCEMLEGYICMQEKKYSDAVSHFEKASPTSVYVKYWLAKANEAAGNKDKANTLFKEVSVYNFNGVDFAVIRNEVRKKVGATP